MRNQKPILNRQRNRFLLIIGTLTYFFVYQWVYITWLYPKFGYLGFGYEHVNYDAYLLLSFSFCILPSFWMPMTLTRPSQFIYWILYLVVYIPSNIASLNMGMRPPFQIALLMVVMFVGYTIVGASYYLPLFHVRFIKLSSKAFWTGLIFISLVLTSWVGYVFWGNLRFVSFADVYELRWDADAILAGSYAGYAVAWMAGVINPFFMGWGLYSKRKLIFLVGATGQIFLYSTAGMKSILLSVLFIPFFYYLIRNNKIPFGLKLVWGIISLFLFLNVTANVRGEALSAPFSILMSIIFMRTFGFPGMLTGLYHDFFQDFSLTYFSHVNGINWILKYPYGNPLGMEIGYYYTGSLGFDANAHLWATDGIAGFGLPGILIVSLLCGFIFWVLDSVAKRQSKILAVLTISFTTINICNASLFTTMLTGGLGLLILLLYLLPPYSYN